MRTRGLLPWMTLVLGMAILCTRSVAQSSEEEATAKSSEEKATAQSSEEEATDDANGVLEQQAQEVSTGAVEGDNSDISAAAEQVNKDQKSKKDIKCSKNLYKTKYYQIDGKCNNLDHPLWGSADHPYLRLLPNAYTDGKSKPRVFAHGTKDPLPSSRKVSVSCFRGVDRDKSSDLSSRHNQNLMEFGQYFAHDLGMTPVNRGRKCCKGLNKKGLHPDFFNKGTCFPIKIPKGDRHFSDCMAFTRSVHQVDDSGVAQQISVATHVIDQSTVYGSSNKVAKFLRAFKEGLLRADDDGMLPQDGNTTTCIVKKPLKGCPVAGDARVDEFPGLTATHTIFVREHNRLAKELRKKHLHWDDEKLYQTARSILIAQTQNLVYKEFLPTVLGKEVMKFFGLSQDASYNSSVNPTLFNSFMAAGLRFGHTLITNLFSFNSVKKDSEISLNKTFFRPFLLYNKTEKPIVHDIIYSLMMNKGQKRDNAIALGIQDDLFLGIDSTDHSTDLAARNIQRGRDHGLPGYLAYLNKALSVFGDDLNMGKRLLLPTCLAGLYKSVEDLDLFVGGLCEDRLPGALVGPVFAYIMGQQFKNLREGDRLFFDTKGSHAGFTEAQIKSIKKTGYSGIICRNAGLDRVPKHPFKVHNTKTNPKVNCRHLPDLNWSLW